MVADNQPREQTGGGTSGGGNSNGGARDQGGGLTSDSVSDLLTGGAASGYGGDGRSGYGGNTSYGLAGGQISDQYAGSSNRAGNINNLLTGGNTDGGSLYGGRDDRSTGAGLSSDTANNDGRASAANAQDRNTEPKQNKIGKCLKHDMPDFTMGIDIKKGEGKGTALLVRSAQGRLFDR